MQPHEYKLFLTTGEDLKVSEFDHERTPSLLSAVTVLGNDTHGYTFLTRAEVEDAKRGYDLPVRKWLRAPLAGLARTVPPTCCHLRTCSMADPKTCTLNARDRTRSLPVCWEHASSGDGKALRTAAGHAWASSRTVFIVLPDEVVRSFRLTGKLL